MGGMGHNQFVPIAMPGGVPLAIAGMPMGGPQHGHGHGHGNGYAGGLPGGVPPGFVPAAGFGFAPGQALPQRAGPMPVPMGGIPHGVQQLAVRMVLPHFSRSQDPSEASLSASPSGSFDASGKWSHFCLLLCGVFPKLLCVQNTPLLVNGQPVSQREVAEILVRQPHPPPRPAPVRPLWLTSECSGFDDWRL